MPDFDSTAVLVFLLELFLKSMVGIALLLGIEKLFLKKHPLLADSCWRAMLLIMLVLL
ncbi:MAG: hypothetical protein R3C11_23255 [Planctomycetaceae bacterium]